MPDPFPTEAEAALAALNSRKGLTRRNGQFLGQLVGDAGETPLSPKQRDWLVKILDRAGLPPLAMEATDER